MYIYILYIQVYVYIYIHINLIYIMNFCVYIYIYTYSDICIMNMCIYIIYTARTGVVPGEVRFDWAESVFYAFWDVGGLAEWLTRDDTFQNTKA